MKTLSPSLSAGLWSYTKPPWAQHLAALHLAQYWVFWTLTPREWREGVCPFAWNDPFCHWCICNMPSLKSSPKFRLTSQTPIITQSYYWEKNLYASNFRLFLQLSWTEWASYSLCLVCLILRSISAQPLPRAHHWLPKGTARLGKRWQGAEGILQKGLKGEAVHAPSQSCHTETTPPVESISAYILKEERNFALCLKCTDF